MNSDEKDLFANRIGKKGLLGDRINKNPTNSSRTRIHHVQKTKRGYVNPLYKRLRMDMPRRREPLTWENESSAESYPRRDDEEDILPMVTDPRHIATPALCIQNLSRPLPIQAFKQKIEQIADEPCEEFWLDNLRSHCFVVFPRLEPAIAVRRSLHNIAYPERNTGLNRKRLFVDYVPVNAVPEYIAKETENGQLRRSMKRWQIIYTGPNNSATAQLVEGSQQPQRIEAENTNPFPSSDSSKVYETKSYPKMRFSEAPLNLLRERLNI